MHAVGGSGATVDLDSLINEVLLVVAPSPDFEKLETVSFEAKYEYSDLAKSDSHAIPTEAIYEPVLERVDGHIYADLIDAKPTTSTAIGCDYRAPGNNLARALSDLQVPLCGLPSLQIIPRPPQDSVCCVNPNANQQPAKGATSSQCRLIPRGYRWNDNLVSGLSVL